MNLENSRYIFAPHPLPTLPIRGSDKLFPVHRIYCVGRNYACLLYTSPSPRDS